MMDQTLISEVMQLRSQGLPDSLVTGELTKRGYPPEDISLAISHADVGSVPGAVPFQSNGATPQSDIYSRFEEIAETFDCYKFNDRSFEIRFKIRGHRVAIGVFALEQAGNGTLSLDRVLVGEEDKRRQFFDKYKLVIEGLARLNPHFQTFSFKNNIFRLNNYLFFSIFHSSCVYSF